MANILYTESYKMWLIRYTNERREQNYDVENRY